MPRYCSKVLRRRNARLTASAVAAGALLAAVAGHAHAPSAAAGRADGAQIAAARGGGTLNCSQLEALWESAGGSPAAAVTAAAVATAESSGRQYATDADSNGTTDLGYWQINTSHGSLATYGAYGNARAAVILSADGTDWSPWVTYRTGAYAGKC